ncbi:GNAT family N-acetyltransferase [Oceanicella actignis]|uniref:Ribosomal protein S18 acetylase RimI n=1 Tax=Oceanicella actignis TaxID=1189325 RepID=A0A1M7RWR0_9RHOB|nr:GNAT family N-acetyltransferase [Oceanicella actignis]SES99907.1 Ribosomal protein S18 acetylase RimI [Oceanicella actignis]SHN50568.1 Ribosomal protein S18 acetylase RimI [Oceanicella actignis]
MSGPGPGRGAPRVEAGRRADGADCARIEHACARMFLDSPHPEAAAEGPAPAAAFADCAEAGRLLVARIGGRVAGFLVWEVERDSLHVCELDVDPAFQRRGVARALIAALARRARAMDRAALTLTTYADVPWNAPVYARLGFAPIPPEEWTPECRADLAALRRAGLDASARIAMRRDLEAR